MKKENEPPPERENRKFLLAAKKQRERFAIEMNDVHDWKNMDVALRVTVEDLLIFYDEMFNRMKMMDLVFEEAGLDQTLDNSQLDKFPELNKF